MQDFRSMMSGGGGGGGGGRIFGGERRLRPFPNQALKCPRCDSLNTKFCYYNNYNLSQPRHFCKSCRRYWTKGGVLRNVPVGGGCRKTKRSKPKTSSTGEIEKEKKSTTSHSSSDSSSLTATTTTEAASSNSAAAAALLNFPESTTTTTSSLLSQNPNSNFIFEQSMIQLNNTTTTTLDQGTEKNEMFPETGGFTGLMNASNTPFLGFNFSEISPFRLNHHHQQQNQEQEEQEIQMQQQKMVEELKFQELTKGLYDHQTVDMHGLAPNRTTTSNGGLTALDWQQSSNGGVHDHQGLFDLPNSSPTVVDHQSYWSQTNQWNENDHSLYLP